VLLGLAGALMAGTNKQARGVNNIVEFELHSIPF
jgi:hypothetical protein